MNEVVFSNQFKKDFKKIKSRGYKLAKLKDVIGMLEEGKTLPERFYDHKLNDSKEYQNL